MNNDKHKRDDNKPQVIGKSQTEAAKAKNESETYPDNKRDPEAKAPNLGRLQELHLLRDKGELTPGEESELKEIEAQVKEAQNGENSPVDLRPSPDVPEENR